MSDSKKLAAALKRLDKLKKRDSFDPTTPGSVPTKQQQAILKDIETIQLRYVIAGNQCNAKGTLVATPKGPVAIEDIARGDTVYDENGKPIKVKEVFSNGLKKVYKLSHRGMTLAKCTKDHVWLTKNSSAKKFKLEELKVEEFKRDTQIKRVTLHLELGQTSCPEAYSLGALLGDGCSRYPSRSSLQISCGDEEVVKRIASDLGQKYHKCSGNNYSWLINSSGFSLYDSWCRGRYAHEKIADLEIIKTWDRTSLLNYVAGLIDTDGSIYVDSWDNLTIRIEMQAKSVIESLKYAFLALWQTEVVVTKNDRDKYVNGPTYSIKCANNAYTKRMVYELDKYLEVPRKKWNSKYNNLVSKRTCPDYIGVKVSKESELIETYDIHVDSPTNLYCLANGLVTHNSGKSMLAAREIAWILNDDHPFWTKPTRWGDEPLLIIIAGQDRKMMEIELWEKKLALFLDKADWRGVRQGGTLQYVENRKTGDKVVFLSHSDSSEKNRKHMQGYVAHYVWLDEMPSKVGILEELQRRVDARRGYLLATFTPKFRNDAIRKIVDAGQEPLSKRYRLSKLDNPLYKDRLETEIQKLDGYNESMKNAILYGDWMVGEGAVYDYNAEFMEQEPENYSYAWRHVVSVDPALKSKCGFTLWAEEPGTGTWYLIKDNYITGVYDPESLALAIEEQLKGYNVIRRITDNMAWFVGAASKLGITYMQPYDKNSRKDELIKNLQAALSKGKIKISPWCTSFKDEIQSCHWSETSDKMINSSSYHTLDSSQYFVDCMPKYSDFVPGMTWEQELRVGNKKRKQIEATAKKVSKGGRVRPLKGWKPRTSGGIARKW